MKLFGKDKEMELAKRPQTLVLHVKDLDGKEVDGLFTVYVYDPRIGEVMELPLEGSPIRVTNLDAFVNYRVWVEDEEGRKSFPIMVYLMKHGGRVIPPPGCSIPPSMIQKPEKEYEIVVGKGTLTMLLYDKGSMPIEGAMFLLTHQYTEEQITLGPTNEHGQITGAIPLGRWKVAVLHEGEIWETGRTIRVRKKAEYPMTFIWSIY